MLLAAEYPFCRIEGIELDKRLAGIARNNVRLWRGTERARPPMRIMCGDALEFRFPTGPCLLFLFNPFSGSIMKRLLVRLKALFAERPGELDLLYVNNEQERIIEQQRGFTRLFLGQVRRSRADAIADHKIMANQPDGEYASANYEDCSIWRWEGR